ncbi:translation initiation factor IF-2 [Haladaptatus sp. F3-133]|uniref:Probable translation initiation factor IF-2 n=1 Tax=Halorutilus salinus TaxID=2487751 RepID=A0A9Q4GHS8_9EURY|nr:translation initiation factor IF-2 [Halorutilus salinus]MCX2818108.1 translation initiation factor IF-2 [Halorutilus salinus]
MDENDEAIRTPIVSVLGHVDHGKTTLLDEIRGSAVAEAEAGAITQHIGSTVVPIDVIERICNPDEEFDLPGLLFIDTPGHHAFTTLRSRGGALSDIAVLVVDVNDGFQPQTVEAVKILDRTETPFVVAANKIDAVPGWKTQEDAPFAETFAEQSERVQNDVENALYEIIGDLHDNGFQADRYDRVNDYRSTIGVVPVSAETGEGIPDLLMVLVGLAQRFLTESLTTRPNGSGEGTVVEVKEKKGLGTTVDVLVYDGVVEVGDTVVVGGQLDPIVTEVRALLEPSEKVEINEEDEFNRVDRVVAAEGVKVAAPELDDAMAGAPFVVVGEDDELGDVTQRVRSEMDEIGVETAEDGVVVKADTVGSVEAVAKALDDAEVPIMNASEGAVSRRDIVDAETADEREHRAVIAFNVDVLEDAREYADEALVKLFEGDVIYRLIEEYEDWVEGMEEERAENVLDSVVLPAKFRVMHDHVFRQSDPAVVGARILSGTLERNVTVERMGERLGTVQGIQSQGDDIDEATEGDEVSVAIDGPTVGRDLKEGDVLYTSVPEKHAKALEQEFDELLDDTTREALDGYLEQKRQVDPFWAK